MSDILESSLLRQLFMDIGVFRDSLHINVTEATYQELLFKISGLSNRQQDVICRRYGLEDGAKLTYTQIGKLWGVSSTIPRNEAYKALRLLRHPVRIASLKQMIIDEKRI